MSVSNILLPIDLTVKTAGTFVFSGESVYFSYLFGVLVNPLDGDGNELSSQSDNITAKSYAPDIGYKPEESQTHNVELEVKSFSGSTVSVRIRIFFYIFLKKGSSSILNAENIEYLTLLTDFVKQSVQDSNATTPFDGDISLFSNIYTNVFKEFENTPEHPADSQPLCILTIYDQTREAFSQSSFQSGFNPDSNYSLTVGAFKSAGRTIQTSLKTLESGLMSTNYPFRISTNLTNSTAFFTGFVNYKNSKNQNILYCFNNQGHYNLFNVSTNVYQYLSMQPTDNIKIMYRTPFKIDEDIMVVPSLNDVDQQMMLFKRISDQQVLQSRYAGWGITDWSEMTGDIDEKFGICIGKDTTKLRLLTLSSAGLKGYSIDIPIDVSCIVNQIVWIKSKRSVFILYIERKMAQGNTCGQQKLHALTET